MMPQLCCVDLAIQIKESTLFRASNVGCLGRHRRAGKRTFDDKGQKVICGPISRNLCVCPYQADGHEQLLWRMAEDHRAQEHCFLLPISTSRSQVASYNSLLNAVWNNCGHCLENLL